MDVKSVMEKNVMERMCESEDKARELAERDRHVQLLLAQLEEKDEEIRELMEEVVSKDCELQQLHALMEQELQSRDAENTRLREQLGECRKLMLERQLVSLQLPLKLEWQRIADMPFKMHHYVQSVLVEGTVYVGGGDADGENNFIIMAYDTKSKKWSTLPPYFVINFAMTAVNNQLVLAGGDNHWYETTNALFVWKPETNEWSQPFPELPTPRSACSAVGYQNWLIVVGGQTYSFYTKVEDRRLPVEVLNIENKQWHTLPPTPIPWMDMKTAVVGNQCYVMGGTVIEETYTTFSDIVFTVSIPKLLSQLDPAKTSTTSTSQMWKETARLKFTRATPFSIGGVLLAVGGLSLNRSATGNIHLYQPDAERWVKVEELPVPRIDCTCVVTADGEVLVAGGYVGELNRKPMVRVDTATVK